LGLPTQGTRGGFTFWPPAGGGGSRGVGRGGGGVLALGGGGGQGPGVVGRAKGKAAGRREGGPPFPFVADEVGPRGGEDTEGRGERCSAGLLGAMR